MDSSEQKQQRVTAGKALKDLRISTLGYSSQKAFAEAIGASVRQVAAAEIGEHIGRPTKMRIEDGMGWPRGAWDHLVSTGEHPPVTRRAIRQDAPQVRIVSDGTLRGTMVMVDGKRLDNVTRVEWSLDVNEGRAIAKLTITDAQVDLIGEEVTRGEVHQAGQAQGWGRPHQAR
jgi:hypothetical protein